MYEKKGELLLEPCFTVDNRVIRTALQGLPSMERDHRYDPVAVCRIGEALKAATQPPYVKTEIPLSPSDVGVAAEALARGMELEAEDNLMDPRDHPLGDTYRTLRNFASSVSQAS